MGIKDTIIWRIAKQLRNKHQIISHYNKVMKMPLNQYEEYLANRTFEMMQRKQYSRNNAYKINFDTPTTFTEKRQWLKLYYRDPRQALYTDKYEVRKYISNVLGNEYLVPLITINGKDCFEKVEEIDFTKLPNSFVIKCTHGSHMNIIVKDKNSLTNKDIKKYKKQLKKWLNINYAYYVALELHYKDIKPRIIIEEYMNFEGSSLTDYKFFCFSGKPEFVGIFENRWSKDYKESYLDMDFKPLEYRLDGYKGNDAISKPDNFAEMVAIAKKLSEDYPMVRIDLYSWKGRTYFGEITFTSAAGYDFPNPFEYDKKLGELIRIDTSIRDNDFTYRKQ